MSFYEFIVVMFSLGISVSGYFLLYRNLRKQVKEIQQDNKENEE